MGIDLVVAVSFENRDDRPLIRFFIEAIGRWCRKHEDLSAGVYVDCKAIVCGVPMAAIIVGNCSLYLKDFLMSLWIQCCGDETELYVVEYDDEEERRFGLDAIFSENEVRGDNDATEIEEEELFGEEED